MVSTTCPLSRWNLAGMTWLRALWLLQRPWAVLALLLGGEGLEATPNFLFLLSDDLGYGELSIMPGRPNTNITTPNIDALFSGGMMFTSAYAPPVCAPSRASLMVGKHLGHLPIRGNRICDGSASPGPVLGPDDTTFLQVLQSEASYVTTCIGKWHLGNPDDSGAPWLKGCSEFEGAVTEPEAMDSYPYAYYHKYTNETGDQIWPPALAANRNASRERCMAPGNTCLWAHDLYTEAALDSLKAHALRQAAERASGNGGLVRPFFMYWAVPNPHKGYWNDTWEIVGQPVPADTIYSHEPWPDQRKDRASTIAWYHDRAVGSIMEQLKTLNLHSNTVVFYASDNGAGGFTKKPGDDFFISSGPLTGFKRWLSEGGVRVPLAVQWPGKISAGVVSDEPVAMWDLAPTILDIAGVPSSRWPQDMDGISLWEGLIKPGAPAAGYSHPPLYWEFCGKLRFPSIKRSGAGWGRAVRDGDWKAIWHFYVGDYSEAMLFNITADIGETKDVAQQYPEVVASLQAIRDRSHSYNREFPATDECIVG